MTGGHAGWGACAGAVGADGDCVGTFLRLGARLHAVSGAGAVFLGGAGQVLSDAGDSGRIFARLAGGAFLQE